MQYNLKGPLSYMGFINDQNVMTIVQKLTTLIFLLLWKDSEQKNPRISGADSEIE